jgi:galactonate dehydratase
MPEEAMKIATVVTYVRRIATRPQLLVKATAEDGTAGWGEAGITGRERSVEAVIAQLRAVMCGRSIFDTEALTLLANNAHYFEGGLELCSAMGALDIALHDLRGRVLGVPVRDLIGGTVRDRVPLFYSLDAAPEDESIADALRLVEEGWRALRLSVCARHEADGTVFDPRIEGIRFAKLCNAMRRAIPAEIVLGIDLHRRFAPPDYARFLDHLDRGAIDFVEEPMRAHSAAAYVAARAPGGPRVALGEEFCSKWEIAPYLDAGVMDYCRVDLCLAGGITEGRKIAALCEARYVPLMPHNPLGAISFAANLHFGLAMPNFAYLEYQCRNDKDPRIDAVFTRRATASAGYAVPLDAPGLGIEVDEDALRGLPDAEWRAPQLRDDDGGIVAW